MQRCRTHKIRNVLEQLPTEQHAQVRSLMRAAYQLPKAKEGIAKMEKMAEWLEREYPEAARSLREGLEETFTINRLDLPSSLHRCLGTVSYTHLDVYKRQKQIGGAHGVLVTAVSPIAFKQAVGMLRRGGTCVLNGLPPGEFPVSIFDVVLNGYTIRGLSLIHI